MSDINDRENRKHQQRLEETMVYRGRVAMAEEPERQGI